MIVSWRLELPKRQGEKGVQKWALSQRKSWTDCRPISSNLRFCWPLLKDFAIFSSCQNSSSLYQALNLLFYALTLLDGRDIFSRDRPQPLSRQFDDRLRREKTRSGLSGPTIRRQSDSFHADIVYASLSSDLIAGLQDVVDVPYRVFFHYCQQTGVPSHGVTCAEGRESHQFYSPSRSVRNLFKVSLK